MGIRLPLGGLNNVRQHPTPRDLAIHTSNLESGFANG